MGEKSNSSINESLPNNQEQYRYITKYDSCQWVWTSDHCYRHGKVWLPCELCIATNDPDLKVTVVKEIKTISRDGGKV